MKHFFIATIIALSCVFLSSCMTRKEELATQTLRDISSLSSSTEIGVPPEHVIPAIKELASKSANVIDPENTIKQTVTPEQIASGYEISKKTNTQNPAIKAILDNFQQKADGINDDWASWGVILSGVAVAAGLAGKFLGPPFNIGGMVIEGVAKRCLPHYDNTKKAAVTAIASVDIMLHNFEAILNQNPQAKAQLASLLNGKDPVKWIKNSLEDAQNDLGGNRCVAALMDKMKEEMTTSNSVLKPTVEEFENFVKKSV